MRATQLQQSRFITDTIQDNFETLYKLQQQTASGKRVQTVSDDPLVTYQALNLRKDIARNNSYMRSIDNAIPKVRLSQSALQEITDNIRSVRGIASQAINSTIDDPSILQNLATQVTSILENIIMIGNSRVGGNYIFSGYYTTTSPFTLDNGSSRIIFNGTDDKIEIPIDDGVLQPVSVSGGDMFQTHKIRSTTGLSSRTDPVNGMLSPSASTGTVTIKAGSDSPYIIAEINPDTDSLDDIARKINDSVGLKAKAYVKQIGNNYHLQIHSNILGEDGELVITDAAADGLFVQLGVADEAGTVLGDVIEAPTGGSLDTILRLKNMLSGGSIDPASITDYIAKIEVGLDKVLETHAIMGTNDIRLEQMKNIKQDLNIDLTRLSSEVEDVDFAEVATKLSIQENVYQAALALATRMQRQSILNFM